MNLALLLMLACGPTVVLDDLGVSPEFTLTDQRGAPLSSADLRGRVLVVDFIFTRCPHVCPLLTQRLAEVAEATASAPASALPIDLVSFTVDPSYDTPEVLQEYAGRYNIPPERWHLLTGDVEAMGAVSLGFMQGLERGAEQPVPDITHSQRMLVVDPAGHIRLMAETDPAGLASIEQAALALATGKAR